MLLPTSNATERTLPEPDRAAAGNARYADIAHTAVGAAARPRDWPGDSLRFGGATAGRTRISLPGVAPSGKTGLDHIRLEHHREQTARQILPADPRRKKAACARAVPMGPPCGRNCPD